MPLISCHTLALPFTEPLMHPKVREASRWLGRYVGSLGGGQAKRSWGQASFQQTLGPPARLCHGEKQRCDGRGCWCEGWKMAVHCCH